ncbi:MAG: MarR family transcriptional regulator, partial [Aeromicrobium sp.]
MSAPGSTASLRTANQRRVVEALRADRESELSQAEIARATELAPATVSGIVKTLSAAGFLESERGAGRRGAMVKIARSAGLVAGVDFGHSHLQ